MTLPGTVEFVGGGLLGDYNANGELDVRGLGSAGGAIAGGENPPEYDLNGDGVVDYDGDRVMWVKELKKTWIGDADLNGEFNSGDIVEVFVAGKYETGEEATWDEGDWDGEQGVRQSATWWPLSRWWLRTGSEESGCRSGRSGTSRVCC